MTILIHGPICFAREEVAALKRGAITQYRANAWEIDERNAGRKRTRLSSARPGDLIWTQEPFVEYTQAHGWGFDQRHPLVSVSYPGDGGPFGNAPKLRDRMRSKARLATAMRARDSRLTLEILSTAIVKLWPISADDALASGIEMTMDGARCVYRKVTRGAYANSPQHAFQKHWEDIHGADDWAANPDVIALTFRLIEGNAWEIKRQREDTLRQGEDVAAREALG